MVTYNERRLRDALEEIHGWANSRLVNGGATGGPEEWLRELCAEALGWELPPETPAAPAVPVCKPWCGKRNGHGGCVSAHESRLCKGGRRRYAEACACSDACHSAGRPQNPPPKETP